MPVSVERTGVATATLRTRLMLYELALVLVCHSELVRFEADKPALFGEVIEPIPEVTDC